MGLSADKVKLLRDFLLSREHVSDSALEDFARENRLPRREFWYSVANILAEGTICHDCRYVEMRGAMHPCINCVRGKKDYYQMRLLGRLSQGPEVADQPLDVSALVQANAEGRVLMFPFSLPKIGDSVYEYISETGRINERVITALSSGHYTAVAKTHPDAGIITFTAFDIGHGLYLSRKEAAEARKRREVDSSE